ncbi:MULTISPECIES: FtsW/RodA/SpoVE family cell cycle protein [Gordonibacter]|uniref:Peptidoglycan glycosyltransferase n=2 Tax=Eggerthellaceae TaxID=1643826 RepID=A0A6N8IM62_9ACTN|nr:MULTISPECIES: FtsW/RodA/SpoVE family cell cycle protein [Gordonibacter]MDN4508531.1 FtsW/RodA/SpoVE family cell cycle protein [Gordonibacter sp. RACS_AR49]MVM55054.1 peptidoglycan glycosyltransferase [Gordonibacter urolithinfaciens]MVN16396.1 peptidoglycan glycosyltransferase [Gordonibacter urolithinfaciens]MVN38820.1 peptidoglycan glycosyltransferase [Gordonibacter urolithinfaciens]MVN55569.1 peptidoglycan glycosyltransferase [Gordonibacter urolithinfaciens]
MTRRNIELVLLCVAAPIVVLLFAMLAVNQGLALNATTLGVPIGIFVAFIIAHLATRKFAPKADPAILPIVFALSGIGICFVERLAPNLAMNQVMWLFLGVAFMVLVMALVRNLDKVANYKYTLMIVGFLLLLSPLVPGLGQEIYGSRIWLGIGKFSFQPGEIAKIAIVLFLAGYLAQNREMLSVFTWRVGPFNLPDIRTLLPLLLMWLVALVIVVFEKDLGSALVFFFLFLVMLYVATGKKFYLVVGLGLIAIGGVGAYLAFGHVQVRVDNWLDPFADAQNTGYQLVQGIYSIADGDLFGVGVGRGLAEQIPVVESDYIFAAIAEEIGLLGAAGVLLLFLCLAIRGFVTAARAKSDVSSFVAVGLTTMIVLQAFIIVGGVTRLIPLTGLTLPFISQGGSSLLASFIAVGFLMRCGDEGTGVGSEVASATSSLHANSVLGRVSLGKRLTHAMIILSTLFALLVANLTLIMVVQANYYQNMPGNNHTLAKESRTERGTISTYDGVILAQSVQQEDGTYERVYPAGNLATHVVGYASTQFGTSGIEAAENDTLKGQQNYASWTDVLNSLAGIGGVGNDVTLTLNSKIQQAAQDALSGYAGACVVMDPETGAVLGMASSPTYDAADFAAEIEKANANPDGESTLLNRAIQTLYAPGSTFKIVTLATALEDGVASEDTVFSSPGTMDIGNAPVTNFNKNSYGDITLARATELSSNTVFGQLGVEMGAEKLVDGADKFGFNRKIDFTLNTATSLMAEPDEMTKWELAWSAAGEPVNPQNHPSPAGPQATVLEMALVGCAIANDGAIMNPYLVEGVYNANGERSFTATPNKFLQAVSKETANRVKDVLKGVVTDGTGTAAALPGVEVAGKTGTAEKENGNDSWFVGMAPADNPRVVVAINLELADEGMGTERAQNVLRTALQVQGLL